MTLFKGCKVEDNAKKYTILYAEDELETQKNYSSFLENTFRKVYLVQDGEEAWKLYQSRKPDILLLDITMPGMNGLELARRIRETDKGTKIIILTAYVDQEKLMLATELHLTKYLHKPVKRNEFKTTLQKALDELEAEQEKNDILFLDDAYSWNRSVNSLFHTGKEVALTKSERLLLELLASNKKVIYASEDITNFFQRKKSKKPLTEDGLKGIIKRLRKKLPEACIDNVFGVGYRFQVLSAQ